MVRLIVTLYGGLRVPPKARTVASATKASSEQEPDTTLDGNALIGFAHYQMSKRKDGIYSHCIRSTYPGELTKLDLTYGRTTYTMTSEWRGVRANGQE